MSFIKPMISRPGMPPKLARRRAEMQVGPVATVIP